MEILNPYIGKYEQSSVFLNNGKHGPYLNYKNKLYSVPVCFQKKFNLESAIKIIEYKSKLIKEENDSNNDDIDIVKSIKNKKSLKKSTE